MTEIAKSPTDSDKGQKQNPLPNRRNIDPSGDIQQTVNQMIFRQPVSGRRRK